MRTVATMVAVLCLLTLTVSMVSAADVELAEVDLIAGRNGPVVGTVTVNWDDGDGELQVVIDVDDALDGDLKIDETHLYVGTSAPSTSSPGKLPYMHEDLGGVDSDTYDFGEIGSYEDDRIYIAVHCALTDDLGIDMDGDLDVDADDYALYPKPSAWADGSQIGDKPKGKGGGKGNWAMYFYVDVPVLED